jgi:cytoskeletal protein CcmA (bactofilin family)
MGPKGESGLAPFNKEVTYAAGFHLPHIWSPTMKKHDRINSFFSKDTVFEGNLSCKGEVRIDGRFNGEIHIEGVLTAGESAVIASEIHVSQIIISGEIRGNVIADKKVEIHRPGRVFGNIQSPVVIIYEGATFDGNCSMHKTAEENDKKLAVISK